MTDTAASLPGAAAAALLPDAATADWDDLLRDVVHCTRCPLCRTRNRAVPGAGSLKARLLFVGEAPGGQEDLEGLPFVGPAGHVLSELLAGAGMARDEVYITNVLKCRPPANRDPADFEIQRCIPYLRRQVALLQPDIICTLGNAAFRSLVDANRSISTVHGTFTEKGRWRFFATYHPAAVLRQENLKSVIARDLGVLGKEWRNGHGNHDQS